VHSRSIVGTRTDADLPQTKPPTSDNSGTDPVVDPILDPTNCISDTKLGEDFAPTPVVRPWEFSGRHMPLPGSHAGSSTVDPLDQPSPLATGMPHGSEAISSLGSSVTSASGGSPMPVCPSTRLQHGIRKTKIYTDGTIRYGLRVSCVIMMKPWVIQDGS
jgi:hypothetical protein